MFLETLFSICCSIFLLLGLFGAIVGLLAYNKVIDLSKVISDIAKSNQKVESVKPVEKKRDEVEDAEFREAK